MLHCNCHVCPTSQVTQSLQEYKREKALKDRRRLIHDKAAAYLTEHGEGQGQTTRTKLLATSKNYKPPSEYSINSPTLQAISEETAADSSSDESAHNVVSSDKSAHNVVSTDSL